MSYTYLLAKVAYINSAHAQDRDMDSDDDEIIVEPHIQKIYFATPNLSTIFQKINDVPYGDPVEFRYSEESITSCFERRRRLIKTIKASIPEEIGVYYKDHVAQYFICIIEVPVLN